MARRSQHTLVEIRTMVLQAAETLVANEGSKALTMRNIAYEIGYTVGSIYMVFENMNDLVLHLNARTLDSLIERIENLPDESPAQTIGAIAQSYWDFAERHVHRWNLIFAQRQPDDAPLPDWYNEKIDRAFSRFEAEFKRLTPQRAANEIKQAARALWGGIHGICTLSLNGKYTAAGAVRTEDSIDLLVRSFILGWLQMPLE